MFSEVVVIDDPMIVSRQLYLENRRHKVFIGKEQAISFANATGRSAVYFNSSKNLYYVEVVE